MASFSTSSTSLATAKPKKVNRERDSETTTMNTKIIDQTLRLFFRSVSGLDLQDHKNKMLL